MTSNQANLLNSILNKEQVVSAFAYGEPFALVDELAEIIRKQAREIDQLKNMLVNAREVSLEVQDNGNVLN